MKRGHAAVIVEDYSLRNSDFNTLAIRGMTISQPPVGICGKDEFLIGNVEFLHLSCFFKKKIPHQTRFLKARPILEYIIFQETY